MTAADALGQLQGLWFPTRRTVEGQMVSVCVLTYPPPRDVAVMTVIDNTFHITAAGEYYWTGGRLRVDPAARRLTFVYHPLPAEFDTVSLYELTGDELRICSGGFPWSGPYDDTALDTEYRRVAAEPTADIRALIESVVGGWCWVMLDRA